ncbi:uncharacterized protein N7459_000608 [Penicillium hispanicum]|uniref:uncharacterized protein n=1 Tax=Penicillium hispanicum TaxID=1080232 RepID=UPI00253FF0C1|nr:uncharacterized protein N7459_000608 [Penicillium hispanicum]KAJ5594400.1 hypothetical protein N7459_000608 [Penicillium hispanicum]
MDSPSNSSKPYSCVICHKRKVKCDRQEPCSNCAKANAECIYQPPPPPRRRKRERDANDSGPQEHGKSLRRTSRASLPHRHEKRSSFPVESHRAVPEPRQRESGRMIMKEGNSVYIDNSLWTSVSQELPNAADVLDDASSGDSDSVSLDGNHESILLLSPGRRRNLTDLHPNPLHIFKLWQTFLENVNPLTKILHAPSVQQQILEAMSDLQSTGRELEALMFSIYCIALVSLQAGEVEKSFGESKKKLLSRYRRGAQLALKNASFLRTSNLMVLQAFMFYLLSLRGSSDPHTIWTLSGVALRIAQRIGVHRDGSGYGISIFETEMRRRVWFQLMVLDATSAQSCGVASGPSLTNADAQPPMNANDSDLDPRMTEPAREKEGPTEMMFCLARSEFGKWLRRWSKDSALSNSPWAFLSSSSTPLREKDHAVDELENAMEQRFLQYCDQSIPLHLATIVMARSAIHFTRLMAHHPRQYQDSRTRIPQSEKDIIFENCLKMAEYADYAQMHPEVQRFSWHMVNHMPWDAIIFMLSEMRSRTDPEEKSKVWQIVGGIYSRHLRQMGRSGQTPLHAAIQNLIIKAWRAYTEECNLHNRIPTACPTIVSTLLGAANASLASQQTDDGFRSATHNALFPEPPNHGVSRVFDDEVGNFDFFHDSPVDWNDWDNLLNQFQESLVDDMTLPLGSLS